MDLILAFAENPGATQFTLSSAVGFKWLN